MNILVTGGAGYIGSITIDLLQKKGHQVTAFDNLELGHKEAVGCPLIIGDLRNPQEISEAVQSNKFDAVIHFAAYTVAGLSAKDPQKFFYNNLIGTLNLLQAMLDSNIKNLVFSSSSEVYGEAQYFPVDEQHPLEPTNPYGVSKLMIERILDWYNEPYDLKSVSLRYFNAAGAMLDSSKGDAKEPSTLLITNAIKGALGYQPFKFTSAKVDTSDGSTIRDYIHVVDLADAHIFALDYLNSGGQTDFFNLGTGKGYSTKEVINKVKEITGVDFSIEESEPRIGEPAVKYASFDKARKSFGWQPRFGLQEIIETAYRWHKTHPQGYQTETTLSNSKLPIVQARTNQTSESLNY